ncbi:Cupin 2 conserved barrel domain protein [Halorubrum sp. DM2]|uniref:cupin domain-containing protein n=1 Tax=Halorubrum sp. DM2 TaxID=2527867 RepID=UPI0024B72B14|nr:cupin domain-containing protein [Halorubrum sp. DM2]VTT88241.1 Cupin 2 conserved barrel domain protein [Halorubrum sp. DM2]
MTPVNADDLSWTTPDAENANWRRKQLGEAAGGDALGCSLYELPPGERSWPYHYHTANEEALYVLAGEGTLRLDGETHPLRPGEFAAFPADASGGHRVVNDGDATLRYLVVSTMREPEVTVYPDSEKFGVYVGSPPGGRGSRSLEGYYRVDDDVDYWEGEAGGTERTNE